MYYQLTVLDQTTMNTREALRDATSALINRDDAAALFDSLEAVVRLAARAGHPVALTGESAVLNPLVDVARRDLAVYGRLMEFVDTHRQNLGRPPLQPAEDDGFDKSGYMRVFMDQKRQRQRRAVEIENAQRPERDRLVGRARLDFMDNAAKKWKIRLDSAIEAARQAAGGQRLPKPVVDTVRSQFWRAVDAELDAAETAIKRPK